jgi:hypothetical protein
MSARQKVWAPTASDGSWVPAEVIKQGSTSCMCLTLDGSELEVPLEQLEMREVLTGEGVRDLTSLSYLHEPAILDNLHVRFSGVSASGATPTPTGRRRRQVIYTYCGHICIAVNPYEWLRELYTPDVVQRFRGSLHEDNEPHIYAAAESAYSSMMTGVKDGVGNQSILVSGESGAGKTESVKIMMNYLAQAAGRHRAAHEGGADAARNSMSDVAYARCTPPGPDSNLFAWRLSCPASRCRCFVSVHVPVQPIGTVSCSVQVRRDEVEPVARSLWQRAHASERQLLALWKVHPHSLRRWWRDHRLPHRRVPP